jgi:phosphohistidine phosphatase
LIAPDWRLFAVVGKDRAEGVPKARGDFDGEWVDQMFAKSQNEGRFLIPMVVYFLRHAEAEPDAGSDFERKLTPKGLEQATKVGKFLGRNGLVPAAIVSSPVVRAFQTAKIVGKKLTDTGVVQAVWLACGMTPATCLEELKAYSAMNSVMLVGHEPDFGETIAALLGVADSGSLNIRKASLTAIELNEFSTGGGCLQFVIPVRLM